MKRQEIQTRMLSQNLINFMNKSEQMHYDEFGFSDIIKQESKYFYNSYFLLYFHGSDVVFNSEFCQPFLFWNRNGELDVSGVLDYDPNTQTGTFRHNTRDGVLLVDNVHSYHTYFKCFDKYLPNHSTYVAEYEEVQDCYLTAVIYDGEQYNFKVYHNLEVVYSVDNVFECVFIHKIEGTRYKNRNGYIRYSVLDNTIFKNYLLDINSFHLYTLDDSVGIPSAYFDYSGNIGEGLSYWWQRKRNDIIGEYSINIYLHFDSSKTSQILSEFIKNANKLETVKNIFDEDDTINIKATYDVRRREDIGFIMYCATLYPRIFGYGVMGFSIDELQIGTLNYSEEYKAVYKYSQYYLSEMKYINKKLHELAKQPILPNSLPSTFYENCISTHSMITYLEHTSYYQFGGMGVFLTGEKDDKTPFRNLYNKIFNGIASENKLATKWKNEYDLYKAVVKLYPDTIYQYNTYWLGTQSLDVFIPSLNLGIEYQGLQHYKAVEFFGGEERLKAQIDRDCRKKMLCEENGIKLIYWRYDEPISLVLVKRRIEESI